MRALLISTALGAFAATAAWAGHVTDPSAFPNLDCKSQDLNQMELDQCAGRDFDAADDRLNALYRKLMAGYDAANQEKLKAAEKAWIAWRDAECDYETNGTAGGTINPMMFTKCRTDKTEARIRDLTAQLNCEEGDLTCNAPSN